MAVFPDISPSYSYIVTPQFHTLKLGPTDGDFIQRRKKRTLPLNKFTLTYNVISQSEEKTLHDFFLARYGAWEAFAFFDFDSKAHTGISLGTGNGVTTVFQLKAKSTSARTVYVAGVPKTEGVDYTVSVGGGTDGQDQITFAAAPASGAITADYTGRAYCPNCIFGEDNFSSDLFTVNLYKTGLVILEVSQ